MKTRKVAKPRARASLRNVSLAPTGSENTVSVQKERRASTRAARRRSASANARRSMSPRAADGSASRRARATRSAFTNGRPRRARYSSKNVVFPAPFGPARHTRTGWAASAARTSLTGSALTPGGSRLLSRGDAALALDAHGRDAPAFDARGYEPPALEPAERARAVGLHLDDEARMGGIRLVDWHSAGADSRLHSLAVRLPGQALEQVLDLVTGDDGGNGQRLPGPLEGQHLAIGDQHLDAAAECCPVLDLGGGGAVCALGVFSRQGEKPVRDLDRRRHRPTSEPCISPAV